MNPPFTAHGSSVHSATGEIARVDSRLPIPISDRLEIARIIAEALNNYYDSHKEREHGEGKT